MSRGSDARLICAPDTHAGQSLQNDDAQTPLTKPRWMSNAICCVTYVLDALVMPEQGCSYRAERGPCSWERRTEKELWLLLQADERTSSLVGLLLDDNTEAANNLGVQLDCRAGGTLACRSAAVQTRAARVP
jgi:hypothetical protein